MTLQIGARLGPYEIIAPLGTGGMGEVWRARDTRLGREVALKVLPEDVANDSDRLARFEREAKAVAALSHPNILALHDVGRSENVSFAVMELLEGETLRARLATGAVPLRKAIDVGAQIARGLAAAHEKGIIHRDLKPENIFITRDGRVKLLDFGLARVLEGPLAPPTATLTTPPPNVTSAGVLLGTVGYMAPEQVRGEPADERSDIFALGCLIYEAAAGRRAFSGDTMPEVLHAILKLEPEVAPVLQAQPGLRRVVARCLEKEPSERFQAARDVAFVLDDLAATRFDHASPSAGGRERTLPIAMAVTVAFLVAGATAFMIGRSGRPSAPAAPEWAFQQLTFGRPAREPTLSPDGREVAFVRSRSGKLDVFLQRVGGQNALDLTARSRFDNQQPAFSPDGNQIAFRSGRDGGGIFVMGATGEAVRKVTDGGFWPTWSPDGREIAATTTTFAEPYDLNPTPGQLWVVDRASGARRPILRTALWVQQPAWSPDGKWIAFFAIPQNSAQRDLYTISASAKDGQPGPVAVTHDAPLDWAPVWAPDGRSLYFGSDRDGTLGLHRISIDPSTGAPIGRPEPVPLPADWAGRFSVSRDGSRIAFEADQLAPALWRLSVDPATGKVPGPPETVLSDLPEIRYLGISHDGTRLAFEAGTARENLYTCNADGSNLAQLTDDGFKNRDPRYLKDDDAIAFYSTRGGPYQVWSIDRDGTHERLLTPQDTEGLVACAVSPDSSRIACAGSKGSEGKLVVLSRNPDGTYSQEAGLHLPAKLSTALVPANWSPDGRLLAAMDPTGTLYAVSLEAGRATRVTTESSALPSSGVASAWLPDGRRLLYLSSAAPDAHNGRDGGTIETLVLADLETHSTRTVFSFPPDVEVNDMAIAPDGRSLYVAANVTRASIWLMTRKAAVGGTP
jgi:Tol biopolymer transport system component